MPIGKVPTEEFLIVEVPTEKFPRNKTAAANITAPAANTITITTHIIVPAANIIARDTDYFFKKGVSLTEILPLHHFFARDTRYFCKKGVSRTK